MSILLNCKIFKVADYKGSTNWGFCHKDCRSRHGDKDMLQARVHFIPIRHLRWHF